MLIYVLFFSATKGGRNALPPAPPHLDRLEIRVSALVALARRACEPLRFGRLRVARMLLTAVLARRHETCFCTIKDLLSAHENVHACRRKHGRH